MGALLFRLREDLISAEALTSPMHLHAPTVAHKLYPELSAIVNYLSISPGINPETKHPMSQVKGR